MWSALKSLGNFKPESMRLDFEIASAFAVQKVFGEDVDIWYCLFHMFQNCVKKICEKNKKRYHSSDEKEFATRCRMVPALAFLPPNEVIDGFVELIEFDKNHSTSPGLLPEDYVTYFEKYYIGKEVRRKTRSTPR